MNLVEKLMKIDSGEFDKKKTKEIPSKILSEVLGEQVKIKIESVDPQMVLEMSATGLDDDGDPIIAKTLETNSLIAAAAVVDPPLKDAELMKHLGVATPAQAALKLFKGEVNTISAKVNEMAGFNIDADEVDKEVKN